MSKTLLLFRFAHGHSEKGAAAGLKAVLNMRNGASCSHAILS